MKKQNLTKFALSLVCAAVLSACGGSDNAAPTTTAPTAEEAQANAIKALLEKATASNTANTLGLTDDQLKAFAQENHAQTFDDAALKAALAEFLANATKPATSDINDQVDATVPFTNFQIAKNNKSNLGLDDIKKTSSDTISFSRGTVKFHPSFDTIVVATPSPTHSQGKTVYLEDLQFNGTKKFSDVQTAANDVLSKVKDELVKVDGQNTLTELKEQSTKSLEALKGAVKTAEDAFKADASKEQDFKNATAAYQIYQAVDARIQKLTAEETLTPAIKDKLIEDYGLAIFAGVGSQSFNDATLTILTETGLLNTVYADNGRDIGELTLSNIYKDVAKTKDSNARTPDVDPETETKTMGSQTGKALVYQNERRVYITADTQKAADAMNYVSVGTAGKNNVRPLADSVAEVYGNKTFTYEINSGTSEYDQVNDGGNNLPLFGYDAKTGTYKGARLSHVQYGRVTSKLHNVDPADLKAGVPDETLVGSYGSYGKAGTENHFFARGSDHINADSLKALGNSATLVYEGHAVSYGLNNRYDGLNSNAIPNAIGTSYKLHSGNHVEAKINLADNTVTGSIFNKWTTGKNDADGNLSVTPVELVKFTGTLAANGNITGDAALTYGEKTAGTLSAALYGQQAQELGGAVQSKDYTDGKAWGAVFGAHRVEEKKTATETSSPFNPRNEIRN